MRTRQTRKDASAVSVNDSEWEALKQEAGKLVKDLGFDEATILRDTAKQPELFMRAAQFRIQCLRTLARKKIQLDNVSAQVSDAIRRELQVKGEKVTEKRIEELVYLNNDCAMAVEARADAEAADELSRLVVEAYRHRRDALKVVADMVGSEISLQKALEIGKQQLNRARDKARNRV